MTMRGRVPVMLAALAATASALAPGRVHAQAMAAIGVEAAISTTALSVGQQADLVFASVVPGVALTVDARSTSAGLWEIHGNRNAEIAVTLTLPTQLSTGFWTMPISFATNAACWRRQNAQGGCTRYDPATTLVERIRNNAAPNNTFYVWIGGTVSPTVTQHTGVYLGTITLTVAYTGN